MVQWLSDKLPLQGALKDLVAFLGQTPDLSPLDALRLLHRFISEFDRAFVRACR